jgi:aminoglycoside 2'-N-acetyltransferase I
MKTVRDTFQIIIRRYDNLDENENREIEEVAHLAFTDPEDELDWSDPKWLVVGKLAGRIVSIVGILTRHIRVGETTLEVGGIGGVATLPDRQQHGFGSALLQRAAEFMRDELKVDFGLLICDQEMVSFYSKLGWQTVEGQVVFDFHGTMRALREITMRLPLGDSYWPEGTIDLCGAPW